MAGTSQISKETFVRLAAIGGGIGIAMSVAGHFSASILDVSPPAGGACSMLFGALYGRKQPTDPVGAAIGGALTGASTAALGIMSGLAMGDQAPVALFGIVAGGVAGGLGAVVGRLLAPKPTLDQG